LVCLLHVTVLQPPDAFPGGCERRREDRVEHQARAAAFPGAIGDGGPARVLRPPRSIPPIAARPCIGDGVVARATRQVQKEFLPAAPVVEPNADDYESS
jgi:hypothetical protein